MTTTPQSFEDKLTSILWELKNTVHNAYDANEAHDGCDEAVKAILELIRESMPEDMGLIGFPPLEEIDNHNELRVYGLHQGWDKYRTELLRRIGEES